MAVSDSSSSPKIGFSIADLELTFEPHLVAVDASFQWEDLSKALNEYLALLQSEFSVMPREVARFCEEIQKWLKDPASKNENPKAALEDWSKKSGDFETPIPELIVIEV